MGLAEVKEWMQITERKGGIGRRGLMGWLIAEVERLETDNRTLTEENMDMLADCTAYRGEVQSLTALCDGYRGDRDALKAKCEDRRNMLEDVVNELDLSDSMIDQHGPHGTAPATLVRLILERKDKEIAMLKAGMVPIGDESALTRARAEGLEEGAKIAEDYLLRMGHTVMAGYTAAVIRACATEGSTEACRLAEQAEKGEKE